MNQLEKVKVIDNDFVPVYLTDKGTKVVIARELHEALFVSTRFNDWIQRNLLSVGFIEDQDFYSFLSKTNGRPSQDYVLTLDTAKHIAMIQRTELGMKIRQKFIDLEKEVQQRQPQSVEDLIIMQAESVKELKYQVKALETKVEDSENTVSTIQETFLQRDEDWRKSINNMLNRAAFRLGGQYRDLRNDSYKRLEERGRCDLNRRLSNLLERLEDQGATKSRLKNTNKMDVIESDPRLKEIYTTIVKEMSIGSLQTSG